MSVMVQLETGLTATIKELSRIALLVKTSSVKTEEVAIKSAFPINA